jgi:SOS-response transcriptional repressor LexA
MHSNFQTERRPEAMEKNRKTPESKTKFVHLAGDVSQGAAIDKTSASERVLIPERAIDVNEIVFRAREDIPEIFVQRGDLLIVERRRPDHAATGELVVVLIGDRSFIGHWWTKRGARALLNDGLDPITEDRKMRIVGAITTILRWC